MSDRRYKFTLIACCITTIIVVAIWKAPDTMKALENRQRGLGEYVYIDYDDEYYTNFSGILHVNRKCKKLFHKGALIKREKVTNLKGGGWEPCPYCVSDKDYETLEKLSNKK